MAEPREVELHDTDGEPIARATVSTVSEGGPVRAALHVESGHLPADTRGRLIDVLLEQPEVAPGTALTAAVAAGEGELIEKLHECTTDTASRRAGATTLVEGTVSSERGSAGTT